MTGYDTPEIRPRKTVPNREEVKAKARVDRDFLKSKLGISRATCIYSL